MTAEIQLRTIALDFWAVLEHQMKYKQSIAHESIIQNELKRCADEIASVDISMQTIRKLLRNTNGERKRHDKCAWVLVNYYQKLIRLRHEVPVITGGIYEFLDADNEKVYTHRRKEDAALLKFSTIF